MKIQRKLTCRSCGQRLWLREFYKRTNGTYFYTCKECSRREKREKYARERKIPDRFYVDAETGRLMEHKGLAVRIVWTTTMVERLKRDFPTTKNEELAIDFNVSPSSLARKARELGLRKNEAWRKNMCRKNCEHMALINKYIGNSGQFKKGQHASPATEFKKKTI